MERLIRRFLWGRSEGRKSYSLVKWEHLLRPKSLGGLGIRGFTMMNRALLAKWVWRFTKETDGLWRKVILAKFGAERGGVFPKPSRSSHGVGLWKNIGRQLSFVHDNSMYEIGNGLLARFWIDRWCSDRPLRYLAPNIFRIVKQKHSLVAEVVRVRDGQISISMQFYLAVQYDFMEEMALIHNLVFATPLSLDREDILVWGDDDGVDSQGFSVTAAYDKLLQPVLLNVADYPWKQVWKKGVPLKIQFFVWSASLHRIATADFMRQRRKIWVGHCPFCVRSEETAPHILMHCSFSLEVWEVFFRSFGINWTMPGSVLELVEMWNLSWPSQWGRIVWNFLLHAILWCLWEERNARCFNGVESNTMKVVMAVRGLIGLWCLASGEFNDHSINNFLFLFDRIIRS